METEVRGSSRATMTPTCMRRVAGRPQGAYEMRTARTRAYSAARDWRRRGAM